MGRQSSGGDYSKVKAQLVDVQHIYSTQYAFAALKADKSVVSWGGDGTYGDVGYSKVQGQLVDVQSFLDIYTTNNAFAARKADGSVVVWGSDRHKAAELARDAFDLI